MSGEPLFPGMIYCVRCCMPESNEGVVFDEMGVCQACRSAEQKMRIDWTRREAALRELFDHYRSLGNDYDCIVPISGGKDSTFQLHVVTKVYGLRALAVTFSHNWYTETGRYNLENSLERFDVDHVMFTPKRSVVDRLARESLLRIGDSCWHCHAGVGAFPLQVAVRYKIPLLVWGESVADLSGRDDYDQRLFRFDRDYFTAVSAKIVADDMAGGAIDRRELAAFQFPTAEECEREGVVGIHLSDYLWWDDERQMEFVRDVYGWREDKVEGTFKHYKSVECRMAGVHDYAKFLKRGFGRGTDHASVDVRAGLMTREEALELAKRHDTERPDALDFYLKITGYTEAEFEEILAGYRRDLAVKGLSDVEFGDVVGEYLRGSR